MMPSDATEPVLDHELSDVLHDLQVAEPQVASTPPGIDSGPAAGHQQGPSPWRLWEISTPAAGPR